MDMDFSPVKKRSKSVTSLHTDIEALSTSLEKFHYENESRLLAGSSPGSDASIVVSIINDTESEMGTSSRDGHGEVKGVNLHWMEDSGICDRTAVDADVISGLEQKLDHLSALFQQQSAALAGLREDVLRSRQAVERAAREQGRIASELIDIALVHRLEKLEIAVMSEKGATTAGQDAAARVTARAQALLDALQFKHKTGTLEAVVKAALTDFLQSDALREHVAAATSHTVKQVVDSYFANDITATQLPMLERAHRQLMRQVSCALDDAFRDMEKSAGAMSQSSYKTARAIRVALERHQRLLEESAEPHGVLRQLKGTLHKVLENEVKQWRSKVISVLSASDQPAVTTVVEAARVVPSSPPQPAEPGRSAIDQLMSAAEINNRMREGDINGTFEKALLAADLTLVMAACRAADPARVFAPPCRLKQHVLLSLAQQLAADLVHDTQLKCRYMEETIMNLDAKHPVTRSYLAQVLNEVCCNLNKFLQVYPSHMSSRKIRMLIMAAQSLMAREGPQSKVQ